jgi:hypothetical protein
MILASPTNSLVSDVEGMP